MEHDGQGMSRGIGYVVLGIAWGVTGLRCATYRGDRGRGRMQRGTRVREHACAREWDVRCGVVYDVADAKLAGSARERDRDVG